MKIEVTPGKGTKLHIHVDGEYRATVDKDWWYSEKYRNLSEISEDELTELLSSVGFRRAYNKSLDLLSRRTYGENELKKKLREKDFTEEAIERATERLKELSLLDDEKFAETLAEHLYTNKHYGEKRILKELIFRGISRETAQNAVSSLDKDEINSIVLLLERKYKNKLSDEKGKERVIAALMRYGYSYSDIKAAFERMEESYE